MGGDISIQCICAQPGRSGGPQGMHARGLAQKRVLGEEDAPEGS